MAESAIPVIAIDGPGGSGKGTIARLLAERLGWHLLDSGALYRVLGLAAARKGVALEDETGLAQLAAELPVRFKTRGAADPEIWLGDDCVTEEIRTEEGGFRASRVAVYPRVRQALIRLQRSFQAAPGLVADGRDMGTVVFPESPLKIFLTASTEERAKRRYKQLKGKGIDVSLAALSRDIEERDRRDSERSVAPMRPADDARILDSTGKSIDEVVEIVAGWAGELVS